MHPVPRATKCVRRGALTPLLVAPLLLPHVTKRFLSRHTYFHQTVGVAEALGPVFISIVGLISDPHVHP